MKRFPIIIAFLGYSLWGIFSPAISTARTLRVPQDYSRIQTAISSAESGDEIHVAPGSYEENIVMRDGITLIGKNPFTTSIRGVSYENDKPVVLVGADCQLQRFTITAANASAKAAVIVSGVTALISENIIEENEGTGIMVEKTSGSALIENNRISHNKGSGIIVTNGKAVIRQNKIYSNCISGMLLLNARGRIEENHIYHNANAGISVGNKGKDAKALSVTIRNNQLENNGFSEIQCQDSAPLIEGNVLINKSRAVITLKNADAIIKGNELVGSGSPVISLGDPCAPIIENNIIKGTRRFAILGDTSNATIKNNTIDTKWELKHLR